MEKLVRKRRAEPSPVPTGGTLSRPPDLATPSPRKPLQNEQSLPEAPEIEKAALSVILSNNSGFAEFERIGRKGFFFNPINREIYDRAKQFYQQNNQIDLIGFTAALGDAGQLQKLGGPGYITELFIQTNPVEMLEYYADQLREKYVRRQVIMRSFAQASKARNADVTELLSDMSSSLDDLRIAAGGANGAVNFDLDELLAFDTSHDPDCLVGRRFLVRGGSWMIAGPTGCGKSSLLMQLAIYWATGTPIFGMRCTRPLKTLIFQAEDDFGDVSEEVQGIFSGIQALEDLDLDKFNEVIRKNLILKRVRGVSGPKFLAMLKEYVEIYKPDLVGINPLFAYAGCNILDPSIGTFLRDELFTLGEKYRYCTVVMHHFSKPPRDGKEADDLLYLGFGSSEVQNSFRATSTIMGVSGAPGVYRFDMGKRLMRSGAKDPSGESTDVIYLEHSKTGICWLQVAEPESDQGRAEDILLEMSFDEPVKTSTIQKKLASETGMPRRTFFFHWRKLRKDGLIKEVDGKNGKGWIAVSSSRAHASSE